VNIFSLDLAVVLEGLFITSINQVVKDVLKKDIYGTANTLNTVFGRVICAPVYCAHPNF
jgi:hypothetical protein